MKFYDVILIDTNGREYSYQVFTLQAVKDLIDIAIEKDQQIKSIKGCKK